MAEQLTNFTVLNNGKLLKPQTIRDGNVEDLLVIDDCKSVKGVTQKTSPFLITDDWAADLLTGSTKKAEGDVSGVGSANTATE